MPYKTALTESVLNELKYIDNSSVVPSYSIWIEISYNNDLPDPPQHGYQHPKVEVATAFGRKVGDALRAKLGLDK